MGQREAWHFINPGKQAFTCFELGLQRKQAYPSLSQPRRYYAPVGHGGATAASGRTLRCLCHPILLLRFLRVLLFHCHRCRWVVLTSAETNSSAWMTAFAAAFHCLHGLAHSVVVVEAALLGGDAVLREVYYCCVHGGTVKAFSVTHREIHARCPRGMKIPHLSDRPPPFPSPCPGASHHSYHSHHEVAALPGAAAAADVGMADYSAVAGGAVPDGVHTHARRIRSFENDVAVAAAAAADDDDDNDAILPA